jgi:hypothetical protein
MTNYFNFVDLDGAGRFVDSLRKLEAALDDADRKQVRTWEIWVRDHADTSPTPHLMSLAADVLNDFLIVLADEDHAIEAMVWDATENSHADAEQES